MSAVNWRRVFTRVLRHHRKTDDNWRTRRESWKLLEVLCEGWFGHRLNVAEIESLLEK